MDPVQLDEAQAVHKFEPSLSRCLLWLGGSFALVTVLAIAIFYITGGEVWFGWDGAIVMAVLFLCKELLTFRNHVVTITNDTISGPSVSGWNRLSFGLACIDQSRTSRQSLLWRIDGTRQVHSIDGEIIILAGHMFDRNQIRKILQAIR
jgi:hypothetical protein